ncbi:MAG: hypothetical protein MUF40_05980 [Gemmatimonadaceae bacterium]|nr:hypothetical protein [Gemmatimonadaceae bacterium]
MYRVRLRAVLAGTAATALLGCATRGGAAHVPTAAARDSVRTAQACLLATEAAMRTFWLTPALPLSSPIVQARGQTLGQPMVPRPCTPVGAQGR